jgi:hypothetical protein
MNHFARVIGLRPVARSVEKATISTSLGSLFECFGPPERIRKLIYWNFADPNGKSGFSVMMYVPGHHMPKKHATRDAWITSRKPIRPFLDFLTDRLGSNDNAITPPVFVGSTRFYILRSL